MTAKCLAVAVDGFPVFRTTGDDRLTGEVDHPATGQFQLFDRVSFAIGVVDPDRPAFPRNQQISVQHPRKVEIAQTKVAVQHDPVGLAALIFIVLNEILAEANHIAVAVRAPVHPVIAKTADKGVIAVRAIEIVVARTTIERIVVFVAIDAVDAEPAAQHVLAGHAAFITAQVIVRIAAPRLDRHVRNIERAAAILVLEL